MSAIRELRRVSGAMRCLECGKCSTLCPLSALRNFSVARMAAIHDTSTNLLEYADTVGRCLTCGSCETRCPQGVRFTDLVCGLREALPDGSRPRCPHGTVFQAAARLAATPGLRTHTPSQAWITPDLRVSERGEVALFVGCAPLFDAMFERDLGIRSLDTARAAIRLLNAAGIEPVVLADERCCGHDAKWHGDVETFQALAIANTTTFEERGVKHIVSACAECTRTWRLDYAEAVPRYRPRVEHITEWLAHSGLAFHSDSKVTYQDPCRLARHLGVTDAPRDLLAAAGTDLVEMAKHGVDAQCCGTPGFIRCDADARALQERRLDDAWNTGAEILLTACPKCRIHFACTQAEDGIRDRARPRMEIEDITMFAARTLQATVPESPGTRLPAPAPTNQPSQEIPS